jgi:hypothetical protein
MECNNCNSEDFTEIHSDSYSGHKGGRNRDETEETVFRCEGCGKQGKKFVDGVDGTITFSGVLREE